ncbi:MAG: hypothetical protein IJL66_07050 [Lachnospiraceae bacterium]|nr:hypothetical protein [Lachnospiraceae bacterium]
MKDWNDMRLTPVFSEGQLDCYELTGGKRLNRYYIVSHPDTTRLMASPEVVGYEVYSCLLPSTARMMRYFKEEGQITSANILSILRGALNYPLEESCYREKIRVHDISFLSSERVFHNDEIAGLEIKYSKLAMVPDSTLLIGDILATGDTLVNCLRHVTDHYRRHGARLRNIIFFTIGGTRGIEIMERLTQEFRRFWPDFEGFIGVYYDGIFTNYEDKGLTGVQVADVDFYWKGGIVAPAFRRRILEAVYPLYEKCTIYDGGARRYEISDHIREVEDYWVDMRERADCIDFMALTEDKLGYALPISFEDWLEVNHYGDLPEAEMRILYDTEQRFLIRVREEGLNVKKLADKRLAEFGAALAQYKL